MQEQSDFSIFGTEFVGLGKKNPFYEARKNILPHRRILKNDDYRPLLTIFQQNSTKLTIFGGPIMMEKSGL